MDCWLPEAEAGDKFFRGGELLGGAADRLKARLAKGSCSAASFARLHKWSIILTQHDVIEC